MSSTGSDSRDIAVMRVILIKTIDDGGIEWLKHPMFGQIDVCTTFNVLDVLNLHVSCIDERLTVTANVRRYKQILVILCFLQSLTIWMRVWFYDIMRPQAPLRYPY
jgi:hypothetical protein